MSISACYLLHAKCVRACVQVLIETKLCPANYHSKFYKLPSGHLHKDASTKEVLKEEVNHQGVQYRHLPPYYICTIGTNCT